jgi:pimeloyl-ACP methyl ester carboxylesterase
MTGGVPAPEELDVHGRRIALHRSGAGPVVVLLHGLGADRTVWADIHARLAGSCTVISLDLPGHGRSDPPPGDYSTGCYACTVRDVLDALGIERATLVGHSLGGGIAIQFGYQFPERCAGLVLVASGGLGPELSPWLRAATLPGADLVLRALTSAPITAARRAVRRLAGRPAPANVEVPTATARAALRTFLRCLRTVADHRGQRVDATSRLHVLGHLPTLLVWGERDPVIPVTHAQVALAALAESRLELFEGSGHCPHLDQPARFTEVVRDHVARVWRSAPAAMSAAG